MSLKHSEEDFAQAIVELCDICEKLNKRIDLVIEMVKNVQASTQLIAAELDKKQDRSSTEPRDV